MRLDALMSGFIDGWELRSGSIVQEYAKNDDEKSQYTCESHFVPCGVLRYLKGSS